jgi:hypothetical protein
MMTESKHTAQEYWHTVKAIAKECKELYPDQDDDERHDYIHDSVDVSYWIVYRHINEVVLQASGNKPDGKEVQAISKPAADWREIRQIAAYLAMEADILEALEELDKQGSEWL